MTRSVLQFRQSSGLQRRFSLTGLPVQLRVSTLVGLVRTSTVKHGYHFKESTTVLHDQAFADDLSIVSSTPLLNQETINVVQIFLIWAFLKAKPPKCVCMGMKKFDPRNVHKVDYQKVTAEQYSPFDPDLSIAGEKIKFIINVAVDPNSLQYDHFKELGRFISVDLTEDKIKREIRKRFSEDMEKIETSGVNGL